MKVKNQIMIKAILIWIAIVDTLGISFGIYGYLTAKKDQHRIMK